MLAFGRHGAGRCFSGCLPECLRGGASRSAHRAALSLSTPGSTGQRSFSGQRGIANGSGGKGVNAQCEYLITGPGIGTGVCLFSDGAKYQMHFGS